MNEAETKQVIELIDKRIGIHENDCAKLEKELLIYVRKSDKEKVAETIKKLEGLFCKIDELDSLKQDLSLKK